MKHLFIIISILLLFNSQSIAQGFFGKKNFAELTVSANNPLIYNFFTSVYNSKFYKNEGGTLVEKKQRINTNFHLNIGRVLDNNFAFLIEAGRNSIYTVPQHDYGIFVNNFMAEMFQINKMSIMPKLEFTYGDGLLPVGLYNQIGIGFNFYNPVNKDYLGYYVDDSYNNQLIDNKTYYNYSNDKFKGYTFLYKLGMRIPVNEFMLVNFGFRYTFNFVPGFTTLSNNSYNDDTYIISRQDMHMMIKQKENRSLMYFETGLTFSF